MSNVTKLSVVPPTEVVTTTPAKRRYDDPSLSGTEFLREIMYDPTVLLEHRIAAAKFLLKLEHDNPYVRQKVAEYQWRIHGGPAVLQDDQ